MDGLEWVSCRENVENVDLKNSSHAIGIGKQYDSMVASMVALMIMHADVAPLDSKYLIATANIYGRESRGLYHSVPRIGEP